MKKNKLLIFCSLLTLFPASLWAETHLVINKGLDNEKQIAFQELEKIHFKEGGLEFHTGETWNLPYETIETIYFASPSSVKSISSINGDFIVAMSADKNSLRISGANGENIEIFDVKGQKFVSKQNYDGASIDISSLSRGIYIVRCGNKVKKIIK